MENKIENISLALGIGLLPPIWAVVSSILGNKVGAVSLICAALFVVNGNKVKDTVKISLGFIISVIWGCITRYAMITLPWGDNINVFFTLCIMGIIAVVIGTSRAKEIIYLPSWLCGWAITLTILGNIPTNQWGRLPVDITISMIVGVVYVGAGVFYFQNYLSGYLKKLFK